MSTIFRVAPALALPILLGAAAAGCVDISAGEPTVFDTIEKRFTVSGAPTVKVETFDGRVDVSTWNRAEVLVVIEKLAMDRATADRMIVEAKQDGDQISVSVREERDGGLHFRFGPEGARITMTVPANTNLDTMTGDGRVSVQDVAGDIRVRTGDGSVRLEGISGTVDASSGDGSIVVDGAIRRLTARSGDGSVRVRAATATVASDWSIHTGDGSVTLEVPDGFNAELDASTGDGRVEVSDLPFDGPSRSRHGFARGRIGTGGGTVTIRTGDGSIVVRRGDFSPRS